MKNIYFKKVILLIALAIISMQLSGCFENDDDEVTPPATPTVITWDKLVWDDGSGDPNTLWED